MKNLPILSALCILLISGFCCTKDEEEPVRDCFTPLQVVFEIRDAQDRDMLNPATPGHYDTLKIKQLNAGNLRIVPIGSLPQGDKSRIRLLINNVGGSYQMKIDKDLTAEISMITEPWECTLKLTSFKYNYVEYPQTSYNYYVVKLP